MSDFYDRLDEHERKSRIDRLIANRPENLHDYQGCANDAAKQSASEAQPVERKCQNCGQSDLGCNQFGCWMNKRLTKEESTCGECNGPLEWKLQCAHCGLTPNDDHPVSVEPTLADDWENWSPSVKKAMYRFYRRLAEHRGRQIAACTQPPSDMPEPLVSDEALDAWSSSSGTYLNVASAKQIILELQQWRKFGASLKGVK